jgi:(1->4)-alpha-D-glucan 1-alpha-D-glucosylmutase
MGFADVWNRTLVYFGIAEEEDDWDEDGYLTEEDLERTYSERPNVRRLTPRGRQQDFDDWTDPDPEFEAALHADVEAIFSPARSPRLLDGLEQWVGRIGRAGLWTAAVRSVLHLAAPGTPDLYQGDELWNFALVDPDNRRPVDYARREALLAEVERGAGGEGDARRRWLGSLVEGPEDGRLKLHLIRAALAARRVRPAPFHSTAYVPLPAEGPGAPRVVAFGRGEGADRMIAVVPRLIARRTVADSLRPTDPSLWHGTVLPLPAGWPLRWRCALSGEPVAAGPDGLRLETVFGILPAALLLGDVP